MLTPPPGEIDSAKRGCQVPWANSVGGERAASFSGRENEDLMWGHLGKGGDDFLSGQLGEHWGEATKPIRGVQVREQLTTTPTGRATNFSQLTSQEANLLPEILIARC